MSGWRSKLLPLATETALPSSGRRGRYWRGALVVLVIAALWAVVFAPFIVGEKVLLYKAIGSDSLNQEYPIALHLSDYVRTNGFPRWSFQFGIGQSIYHLAPYLLFNPVAWLPRAAIAAALPWQFLLKLTIAGLLFFRFLQLRGLDLRSSVGGAMLAAFSTYMCFGCCWPGMGNEFIAFAFLLVAIETALATGRWFYVPCAVGVAGLLTVFHLYLSALLLGLYVPARIVALYGWQMRPWRQVALPLAGAALLGCGLAAVMALDGAAAILDSPRAPTNGSRMWMLASSPMFALGSLRHDFTWCMRWFSTDLIGTDAAFRGWNNYLEAPINYWGLLVLILAPQTFIYGSRRQRVLGGLFLIYLVVPFLLPWIRYAFWAFQGDYYRTYSLFGGFGAITLAMTALMHYGRERKLNLWLLAGTVVLALAVVWFPSARANSWIVPRVRTAVTVYIAGYAVLLAAGQVWRRQSLFAGLVLVLTAVELAQFNRLTVAGPETLTKTELHARVGYNDYTVDAIRELQSQDRSFYRVSKTYSSGPAIHASLNDQMVFGYFGTGGIYTSFNDMDYIRFLAGLDVIGNTSPEFETRWAPSVWNRAYVATFVGEKYFLTRNPEIVASDATYEFLRRHGDIHVFRNNRFVPFGVTLPRFVLEDEFVRWPTSAKENALFYAAVLSEKDRGEGVERSRLERMTLTDLTRLAKGNEPMDQAVKRLRATGFDIASFAQNHIAGTARVERDGIMVFQTAFDPGWRVRIDGMRAKTQKADFGLIGVPIKAGRHEVRMDFVPYWLLPGLLCSVASALVLAFAALRWPRLPVAQAPLAAATPPELITASE